MLRRKTEAVRLKTNCDGRRMSSLIRILLLLCALAVGAAPLSGVACGVTRQVTQSCECCEDNACCVEGSKSDPVSTQPLNTNISAGKISFNIAPFPAVFARYSAPQTPLFFSARAWPARPAPDRTLLCTFLI